MAHPFLTALAVVAVLIAAALLALRYAAPRSMGGVRVVDPAAAKAAGDELLASRDATVLVCVAHPDDAEWWVGGTLGMLARENRVVLLLGTSGDAGNGGIQSDLGDIRERLQVEGGEVLGYADVLFLRHPDGHLAEAADFPQQVAERMAAVGPDIVITFDTEREGPVYHHADHAAAGRAALAAVRARGGTALYFLHSGAPDVIVDYEPVAARKVEALDILRSYHDTSPLARAGSFFRGLGGGGSATSQGGRSRYPEVGVEFGEVLRKEPAGPLH